MDKGFQKVDEAKAGKCQVAITGKEPRDTNKNNKNPKIVISD